MGGLAVVLLTGVALGASALSALTGVGGGVLLLSGLLLLVPAAAVVPLHGAVQSVAGAARVVAFRRHVRWPIVGRFLAALMPGSLLGLGIVAWLVQLDTRILELLLALAILGSLVGRPRSRREAAEDAPAAASLRSFYVLGFACGVLTVIVGSTGPLVTRALLLHGVTKEPHVATKSVVQSVGHALKIPLFGLALGFDFGPWAGPLAAMGVAVLLGTWLGKRLLMRWSTARFVTVARVLLVLVALQILASGIYGVWIA
ncbi:MAG TPA: TSUP family transporter [Sandaracinaceae bacterium LLY-WYZ-13_1]|nr:TSUP family transporter [Sandaracinaceae bacterium LLY-WYZ-13_1]